MEGMLRGGGVESGGAERALGSMSLTRNVYLGIAFAFVFVPCTS